MLSFFPRDVLDEILNLIESVSEGFTTYSYILIDSEQHAILNRDEFVVRNHQGASNYYLFSLQDNCSI